MCTSFVINKSKTLVGWNLDLNAMEHRVRTAAEGVYIEVADPEWGWLPLFGANSRGDFVAMPTCWPFDSRSDPTPNAENLMALNIDLLLQKKTLAQLRDVAESSPIASQPGVTFMSALSDNHGNVLHIIPGQGHMYYERPAHAVLTNFSPFKQDSETHPWMGWDRYATATALLEQAEASFDVPDCFAVLKATAQTACPTVVSMVFDVTERTVHWCLDQQWEHIQSHSLA